MNYVYKIHLRKLSCIKMSKKLKFEFVEYISSFLKLRFFIYYIIKSLNGKENILFKQKTIFGE